MKKKEIYMHEKKKRYIDKLQRGIYTNNNDHDNDNQKTRIILEKNKKK